MHLLSARADDAQGRWQEPRSPAPPSPPTTRGLAAVPAPVASALACSLQIEAFEDTWHWNATAEQAFDEVIHSGNTEAANMLNAIRSFLGENDMMAYLAMMAVRLIELHRVLKPTGSLYLHCDPTASHYLKILLDAVFEKHQFRTEISWRRQSAHSDAKQGRVQYGNVRDTIFFYTKGEEWTWNWLYTPYDEEYVQNFYKHTDPVSDRLYRLSDITGPGGAAKGKEIPAMR
jgi:adenine specific DNA methylase Mod